MPDRTECPRCRKVGFVRYENVVKGGNAARHFYCGSCNYSWSIADEGDARQNHGHPSERSTAADKS